MKTESELYTWKRVENRDAQQRHGESEWWNVSGPHAGQGPRGYSLQEGVNPTAGPERIKEDVCRRMASNGRLDARDIAVAIAYRRVVLTGTVPSSDEKGLATDIAESVPGVEFVQNELLVGQDGSNMPARPGETSRRRLKRLWLGQQVVGISGKPIGTVETIYDRHLVVARPSGGDLNVSLSHIQGVDGETVWLIVPEHEADHLHRPEPGVLYEKHRVPMFESEPETYAA